MLFKISSKNAYRDFVRNSRRIAISKETNQKKAENYKELYDFLKHKLLENERLLLSSPAFADRCQHWNQRDIKSIRPVKTIKNPWLAFKREFEQALKQSDNSVIEQQISTALAWFYANPYKEDWLT